MAKATTEMQFLLEQWGRWARTQSGAVAGFPSQTPWRRMLGSAVPSAMISDEVAAWVDALVSSLSLEHPSEAEALALRHVCGLTHRGIAKQMKRSQRDVQSLLEAGEMWVEGRAALSE